jgi:threonine synthase
MHEVWRSPRDPDEPRTLCPKDGGAPYVRYDLRPYIGKPPRTMLGRTASMWRYAEVLLDATPVSLGEGYTPLM